MKTLLSVLSIIFILIQHVEAKGFKYETRIIDETTVEVAVQGAKSYILLPVEDKAGVNNIYIGDDFPLAATLAVKKIDARLPMSTDGKSDFSFIIKNIPTNAIALKELTTTDIYYDPQNREKYRPYYHVTPYYGWMNDPNGLFYKDGLYHLYYLNIPYSKVSTPPKYWVHSVSQDLVHWEDRDAVICPDELGTIKSGCIVIDHNNDAGFGEDALLAFYSQGFRNTLPRQVQSVAYSIDGGDTFTKYEGNPILTPRTNDVVEMMDFRDPKIFFCEQSNRWIQLLVAGNYVKFYASKNLLDWKLVSEFGGEEYCNKNADKTRITWECADLVEMPIAGDESRKVWVLIINSKRIDHGGTQYIIGDFDGEVFKPAQGTQFQTLDFGRDHYAAATWRYADKPYIIAWMSNLHYARKSPTRDFRSAQSVVRELSLFEYKGKPYVASSPVEALTSLRKESISLPDVEVNHNKEIEYELSSLNDGAYEIELDVDISRALSVGFMLKNSKGEHVDFYMKHKDDRIYVDRNHSGVSLCEEVFNSVSQAPLWGAKKVSLRLLVDKCSTELFIDEGKSVLTNLVFPAEPYDKIVLYTIYGSAEFANIRYYPLSKSVDR